MSENNNFNETEIKAVNKVQKRNTIQKKLVLEAVHQLQNHPTAEEVYKGIIEVYRNISKGTVYRNLNILVEENELIKVLLTDGADRFDHNTFEHNHIKCDVCNRCFDMPQETYTTVDKMICINRELSENSGFIVKGYEILFRGICPRCREGISGKP